MANKPNAAKTFYTIKDFYNFIRNESPIVPNYLPVAYYILEPTGTFIHPETKDGAHHTYKFFQDFTRSFSLSVQKIGLPQFGYQSQGTNSNLAIRNTCWTMANCWKYCCCAKQQ